MHSNVIETKSLTKYYGKTRGVEDLTFSVKKGEIFGFLSPNGVGKTTTIRNVTWILEANWWRSLCFWKKC
ncbi:MAG TPA: hypothetical protein EYP23_03520 [Thermoplasmata archaeon]|nr:hypothetical protein [Thermoplasmata archaeon]